MRPTENRPPNFAPNFNQNQYPPPNLAHPQMIHPMQMWPQQMQNQQMGMGPMNLPQIIFIQAPANQQTQHSYYQRPVLMGMNPTPPPGLQSNGKYQMYGTPVYATASAPTVRLPAVQPAPLQTPVHESQLIQKKENRALAIVDPRTGKPINIKAADKPQTEKVDQVQEQKSKLNLNCVEFVPLGKQQVEAITEEVPTSTVECTEPAKVFQPKKILTPPRQHANNKHNKSQQKVDKQISTHGNQSGQKKQAPPRKHNKQSTAKPSSPPQVKAVQEEDSVALLPSPEKSTSSGEAFITCFSETCLTFLNSESETVPEDIIADISPISEDIQASSLIFGDDETLVEVVEDKEVIEKPEEVSEEEKIEVSCPDEVTPEEQLQTILEESVEVKLPYRYSINELDELKNSVLVETKPPAKNHILLNQRLPGNVYRSLFENTSSAYNDNDYVDRKSNKMLTKRNSGEMKHAESYAGSNYRHGRNSPDNNQGMIKITLSCTDVNLNKAENAWMPSRKRTRENMSDAEREITALSKAFRTLLNKITEENLEVLLNDVRKLKIDTKEKLTSIVDILFEKSISEPGYASIYAKLCVFFAQNCTQIDEIAVSEKAKTKNSVKTALITRCQFEFSQSDQNGRVCNKIEHDGGKLKELLIRGRIIEDQLKGLSDGDQYKLKETIHDLQDDVKETDEQIMEIANFLNKKSETVTVDDDDADTSVNMMKKTLKLIACIDKKITELEDFHAYIRRRANGIVKFIGELYRASLLTTKIMCHCIDMLLPQDERTAVEDNVERLCKLLTTVGGSLDAENTTTLDNTFVKLKKLIDKGCTVIKTSRIRFDVMNIVELRASNWKVRINQRSSEICPMKLQDLQEKLIEAENAKQLLNENYDREHSFENRGGHHQQHGGYRQNNQNDRNHHQNDRRNDRNSHGRQSNSRNNNNNYNRSDSDGFMPVGRTNSSNFDLSRLPIPDRNSGDIKLAPTNHGNFSNFHHKNQPQQSHNMNSQPNYHHQQTYQPRHALNPYNHLPNDSDGSDSMYNRGRQNNNNNNNRNKKHSPPRYQQQQQPPHQQQQQPQQQQPQQQASTVKFQILPPGHANTQVPFNKPPFPTKVQVQQQQQQQPIEPIVVEAKQPMDKDNFMRNIKAVYDGKLTTEQMLTKMKGFKLDKSVLCDVCCDFFDKKQPQRRDLMENVLELYKRDFLTKEVIVETFEEMLEFAPDFSIDIPHVYLYIGEYFDELMKGELFTHQDIQDICKDEDIMAKFPSILGAAKASSNEEKPQELIESSPSTASDYSSITTPALTFSSGSPGSPCSAGEMTLLDDDIQAPPGVVVGSFKNIESKFLFNMKKFNKKNNLEILISLIDKENCKYEQTFIQDMTKCLLGAQLEKKLKTSGGPDQINKLLANSLQLLKRYIDTNLSRQMRCIYALQAFVYGANCPDLLKTLFEVFHENEVISYDAFKMWKDDLGEKAMKDKFIMSTNSFFQKLEKGSL